MGDFPILGQGSYGMVLGPIPSISILRPLGIDRLMARPPYIIKVYKKPFQDSKRQSITKKQDLYNRLQKNMRHGSVLFPLTTQFVQGKEVMRVFSSLRGQLDRQDTYQIEVQQYGGKSMEKIVYAKRKPNMDVEGFLKLWRCIPDILEDSCHILFDNNLIMTDIKVANMVLSSDKKLRLIDVDINPNTNTSRVITPNIYTLPPQYFSDNWWGNRQNKNYLMDVHRSHYDNLQSHATRLVLYVLHFIHRNQDPYTLARDEKLTPQENMFQRFFFVAYPLLVMVLTMVLTNCVDIRTKEEHDRVKRVLSFCLRFLQKRGHFSSQINYRTIQRLLWKMRSLS